MALDTIPKQEGGKLKAVASGTLPSGQPVVVNADGTVSVISSPSPTALNPVTFTDTDTAKIAVCYDPDSQKIIVAWEDSGNSGYGTAAVGTVSGDSISFGSEVIFAAANAAAIAITYDTNEDKVVIVYRDDSNSGYGTAIVGTVSGTSISFGTAAVFLSGNTGRIQTNDICFDSTNNKVVFAYMDIGDNQKGKVIVATVSGTSISFGTPGIFETAAGTSGIGVAHDIQNNKIIVVSGKSSGGVVRTVGRLGTISGTSISFGSHETLIDNRGGENAVAVTYLGSGKSLISFNDYSFATREGYVAVLTVDGSSMSFGTPVRFTYGEVNRISASLVPSTGQVVVVYGDEGDSDFGKFVVVTVSGTVPSVTSPVTFESAAIDFPVIAYDENAEKMITVYVDDGNSGFATYCILTPAGTNLTSENYIGMSGGVVSSETVTQALGSVVDITNTAPAYIAMAHDESAGKVIVAYKLDGGNEYGYAAVGTVSGTSITFGTPVAYTSSALQSASQSIAYDSVNNKVVISFTLQGGGNRYGTAIVGTVSGDSISFGSAVTFNAGVTAWITSVFDSSNNKVVISYSDGGNSDYGTAIVGTVSGTSISFGSEVVFESANSGYLGSTFDSTNNKVVVSYRDDGNTGKGTAIVGTVSGTSISFGTAALFNNASTYWTDATFDSTNGKAVILYMDDGNSQYGTAIVGTVSGTDITFGSEVVFSTSATTAPVAAFDSGVGKITVAYRDAGNSNNTTIIPATVSGTSISFDSAVDVGIVNGGGESIGIVFDSTNNRNVIAFKDDTANDNSAVVFRNAGTITTRGQVNSGSSGTVDIIGSVSTNQSGLTAGQQYYVQTDGTIGTTPADPSVLAGTAVSATKMVVKS